MSIIKDLKIENKEYNILNPPYENWICNLSKINIFVGANNTGKSRFMRSLFYVDKNYKLKFFPNDKMFDNFLEQSNEFKKSLKQTSGKLESIQQRQAKQDILKSLKPIDYIEESHTYYPDLIELYNNVSDSETTPPMSYEHECNEIFRKFFNKVNFNHNLFNYTFYRMYIPSLRGLIPLIPKEFLKNENLTNDLYSERIKKDYFSYEESIKTEDIIDYLNKEEEYENFENEIIPLEKLIEKQLNFPKYSIISGLQFYEYVKNYLLGDLKQRTLIRDYEKYLSKTFFDDEEVVLIPKIKDDVLTIKIGDEERQIYELGEGIQSIILITLPLFLYLNKSKEENTNILVFIEEPEIGLHPKLQRILLETLLDERFENYQFFFTTHSNHFIDRKFEDENISIYSFDKYLDNEKDSTTKFNIEKVGFDHLPTLQKLGALPSSVLGSNCTILVEGSYDIAHYNFYLKLYQEKLKKENPNVKIFKKGIHYSFLRGGGKELFNTIKEFNSMKKERIFTILDFDSESESEKHHSLFRKIKYCNYKILDVKEVENLISKSVLIKILESLREIRELGINKEFDENEYKKSNFYKFIKDEIITGETPDNFFKEDAFKKRFSHKEQEFTENYDELSDDAKEITEELYEFIEKNNL